MDLIRKIPRAYYIFGAVALLFCSILTLVEIKNGKFWTNDFRVYYDAVNDFFRGNDPYIQNYGLDSGYFKYPPFTLYLFSFFTVVPFWVGQLFHTILLAFSLIVSFPLLKNLAEKTSGIQVSGKKTWILYVAFLLIAIHLTREFHLGNINLLLLLLFSLGLSGLNKGKVFQTALFWGLMAVLKPIMIMAFIPLLFWKKWKIILLLCGFGIFFFLFPVLHLGWNGSLNLWLHWFRAIGAHGEYIVSENSITYFASHYFGIVSAWIPSLLCLLVLAAIMTFDLLSNRNGKNQMMRWTIIYTAFTPNFFVTDTEHFLLAAPLLIFLLFMLPEINRVPYWIAFAIGALLFSFNSNDLLGRELSDYFDAQGILGIGNIVFIITFLLISRKQSRNALDPVPGF